MKTNIRTMKWALLLAVSGMVAAGPVFADKPSWAGPGKGHKEKRIERHERGDDVGSRRHEVERRHFEERHRSVIREYYAEQFRHGRCPPGLAKKRNGCMPPGQAKKWKLGRPLPREVIFHDVPQQLVVQIGAPPAGYRYVRVATDILMIAVGTGMVIDAINDLGR